MVEVVQTSEERPASVVLVGGVLVVDVINTVLRVRLEFVLRGEEEPAIDGVVVELSVAMNQNLLDRFSRIYVRAHPIEITRMDEPQIRTSKLDRES